MLTVKQNKCDMQTGFRLLVNPTNQQAIFKACGVTVYGGNIICASTKKEIEVYCKDNGITLPKEEL